MLTYQHDECISIRISEWDHVIKLSSNPEIPPSSEVGCWPMLMIRKKMGRK